MSSTYRLLCLNHSPALVIEGPDWQDAVPAIAAALDPQEHDWLIENHPQCDLLVGRYSAPLIEVCCPGRPGKLAHGNHNSIRWIDRDWLVLLHAASGAPHDDRIAHAIEALRRTQSCWTWERVDRLAPHFGIDLAANGRADD